MQLQGNKIDVFEAINDHHFAVNGASPVRFGYILIKNTYRGQTNRTAHSAPRWRMCGAVLWQSVILLNSAVQFGRCLAGFSLSIIVNLKHKTE